MTRACTKQKQFYTTLYLKDTYPNWLGITGYPPALNPAVANGNPAKERKCVIYIYAYLYVK